MRQGQCHYNRSFYFLKASLRAFQKLISGLTWSYTHYQAALILRRWCQVLTSPFSNFGCEQVGLGLGILETQFTICLLLRLVSSYLSRVLNYCISNKRDWIREQRHKQTNTIDLTKIDFNLMYFFAVYLNALLLVRGYRLSNCIDQHNTWPTSLNYSTIVS